jgi:uncharacterized HAD superfamily protein
MKIGIDIDEVIVEFARGYFDFYNSKHGTSFKFEDAVTYDLWKVLGVSREKSFQIADDYYKTESFRNLEIVKGSIEKIKELSGKHKIFIVTSRPLSIRKQTTDFFKRVLGDTPLQIIYSGDLYGGQGKNKAELCTELGLSFFIEDNTRFALECAQRGIRVVLLDKPWNQDAVHENISRVNGWEEIPGKIK